MNKLLVHACCAPCLCAVFDTISNDLEKFGLKYNSDFDIIWYNPNIQPLAEYEMRKSTLAKFLKIHNKEGIYIDTYDLTNFTRGATTFEANNYSLRCEYCYTMRLEKVFEYAKYNNYTHVTTTLLISPYQKHDLIKTVCEKLSKKYNVEFLYYDFRPLFRIGQNMAHDLGLYMQKYCGCVYSIDEAYIQKKLK